MINGPSSRRRFLQAVSAGTVATAAATPNQVSSSAAPAQKAERKTAAIRFPRLRLPVLRRADVVVAGGSIAGVTAALEFAKRGRTVVLLEHRNYLGREITAPLRPWIDLGKLQGANIPAPFAHCLAKMGEQAVPGEIPLWMDGLKITLEDLLLEAGVQIVYASLPAQALTDGGKVNGVVIGNKSSRQVVLAPMILDCTATALVARLAGAAFEPIRPEDMRFVRTMVFTSVSAVPGDRIPVPASLGLSTDELTVHNGFRHTGHVLVEAPMHLPSGGMDLEGMMLREIEARHRTLRLASHLIQNHPAFAQAKLSICAYELDGPQTTRMKADVPAWTGSLRDSPATFRDKTGRDVRLPLAALAGPVNGVWCLNEAARLDPALMALLRDPVNAALAGTAVASALPGRSGSSAQHARGDYSIPDSLPHRLTVRTSDSPQRGRGYERETVPAVEIPVLRDADVLVVGGGTSGATCAAAAAREGAKTVLMEMCPGLGGAGTVGGVSAYWYGRYWAGFCERNAKLVDEVHKTINVAPHVYKLNGPWNIEAKMYAMLKDTLQSGAEPFFNTLTFAAIMQDNEVRGAVSASPYGPVAVLAKVTADTTGDGDVAAFAGASCTYGAARDRYPMWYNLAQYIEPGRSRWHFMHTVDVTNVDDYTRAILIGRRRGQACYDHGCYIAPRETRHIVGDTTVTLTDLLQHRQYPDVVNFGAGQMDCHRRVASDWVRVGLLFPILPTEMPYRALLPHGLENVLVAGKAFSGTHDALYSLRNQPELENLGGAVGVAAAYAAKEGVSARRVNLRRVQKRLTEIGTLLPDMLTRRIDDVPADERAVRSFIDELDGRHLSEWDDVQMAKENEPGFRRKMPFIEICCADPAIAVPALEEELERASGDRQVRLAQALAMFGSRKAAPVLIRAINDEIAKWKPPVPPDTEGQSDSGRKRSLGGGIPTRPADLVYSLGMTRHPDALQVWPKLAALISTDRADMMAELPFAFHFTDAICYGAELLGDPAAIPVLQSIHRLPNLHGQVVRKGLQVAAEYEKRSLIEITLGRTLARLGDVQGFEILIGYLDDTRATFAEFAHMALEEITGRNDGKDSRAWSQWLTSARDRLQPLPLLERKDG